MEGKHTTRRNYLPHRRIKRVSVRLGCDPRPLGRAREGRNPLASPAARERNAAIENSKAGGAAHRKTRPRPHGRAREGVNPLAPPGHDGIENGRRSKLLRPKGIQGIIPCRRASCTWQDASRTHAQLCRTASRPRPGTDGSGTRSGFRP